MGYSFLGLALGGRGSGLDLSGIMLSWLLASDIVRNSKIICLESNDHESNQRRD